MTFIHLSLLMVLLNGPFHCFEDFVLDPDVGLFLLPELVSA